MPRQTSQPPKPHVDLVISNLVYDDYLALRKELRRRGYDQVQGYQRDFWQSGNKDKTKIEEE